MNNTDYQIKEIDNKDKDWVVKFITKEWGSDKIVSRGKIYDIKLLNGFVILQDKEYIGLITYHIKNKDCEIISINSLKEKTGVGTLLLNSVISLAKNKHLKRVWLITTNNNFSGLHFYQKRGFIIKKIYPNAIKQSRKIKPQIPLIDDKGIPIRDEIELEIHI